MPEAEKSKSLRESALARLGRNVLNFQRVEAQLKKLLGIRDLSVLQGSFAAAFAKRAEELQMISMGNLVNKLLSHTNKAEAQDSNTEIAFRIQFRLDGDPNYVEQLKTRLSNLVQERNNLIHQDLAGFNPNSEESCRHWSTRLDEQNTRVEALHLELKQLLDLYHELLKHYSDSLHPDKQTA